MNELTITEYFILFMSIAFIFWGGYLIGINRDKLFPKKEEKSLKELDLELEEALDEENFEEAIKITKIIERKKK